LTPFAPLAVDTGHPGQHSARIGFALHADRWRRGHGAETARLLLRLGFGEPGLHRVWGARSPYNVVSAKLMTKLGMVEGRIHVR
jgi:RimJ/RimL family protein N-acetyltransferase